MMSCATKSSSRVFMPRRPGPPRRCGRGGGVGGHSGAGGGAVLIANLGELLDDDFAELGGRGEDGLELGDVVADFGELFEQLVDGELGEGVELQCEDRV